MIKKILFVLIIPSILFSFSGCQKNAPKPYGPLHTKDDLRLTLDHPGTG